MGIGEAKNVLQKATKGPRKHFGFDFLSRPSNIYTVGEVCVCLCVYTHTQENEVKPD